MPGVSIAEGGPNTGNPTLRSLVVRRVLWPTSAGQKPPTPFSSSFDDPSTRTGDAGFRPRTASVRSSKG